MQGKLVMPAREMRTLQYGNQISTKVLLRAPVLEGISGRNHICDNTEIQIIKGKITRTERR